MTWTLERVFYWPSDHKGRIDNVDGETVSLVKLPGDPPRTQVAVAREGIRDALVAIHGFAVVDPEAPAPLEPVAPVAPRPDVPKKKGARAFGAVKAADAASTLAGLKGPKG